MNKKGISQYWLIKHHNFSRGQLDRLRKNLNVSTYTINTLCRLLNCRVEDIIEYRTDPVPPPVSDDSLPEAPLMQLPEKLPKDAKISAPASFHNPDE